MRPRSFAMLVLVSAVIIYLCQQRSDPHTEKGTVFVAHPPRPYSYATTMEWLRRTNLTSGLLHGAAWVPTVEEFDLHEPSVLGKWSPWLSGGTDAVAAIAAAKSVNRWLFLEDVMRTGKLTSTATPGMHMYILRSLRPAANLRSRPTFVDAGCGTGFLLQAWVQMTGDGAFAVGLDLDTETVSATRKLLQSTEVTDRAVSPRGVSTAVHVANALDPDAAALGLRPGQVDAINVGLAVGSVDMLRPLAVLLRTGGLMAVPLCQAEQPAKMSRGKCAARFTILSKGQTGRLTALPDDPGVKVTFIRAITTTDDSSLKGVQPSRRARSRRHVLP